MMVDRIDISDSVIMGDVVDQSNTNITNVTNNVLECPQCHARGSIILYKCDLNITNRCLINICDGCRKSHETCESCLTEQKNKELEHNTFQSNMILTLIYIFAPLFLGPTLFLINWKMAVSIFITWVPFGFYYVVSGWVRYYRNST